MRIERLGKLGAAPGVLRAVAAATAGLGLPPPAALTGEWFGSLAVIAPSVVISPVGTGAVFGVRPGSTRTRAVGGGWIGYLSYPDEGADGAPARVPEAAGGWTDCVLRCDLSGQWWFESLSGAPIPGWLRSAITTRVAPSPWHVGWTGPDRDAHRWGVLACLEAIGAGEIYQACVCTQFGGILDGSPLDFFADAVARTTPARAAYLAGPWGAVASLSPELFLRRHGDSLMSSPIKGTLPLGADPRTLLRSVKDVAENIMIVDLVRNDLGRIAVAGSVDVPELLAVKPAPGVWHLVSTVAAKVPASMPMCAVLDATFPPASVTGTPKSRARELLSLWESRRRGIYCGAVGLASPVAGAELNVAIRTVELDSAGNVVLGVGGGITADSDPDTEWQECLHKAAATVSLAPASGAPPAQVRERRTAS